MREEDMFPSIETKQANLSIKDEYRRKMDDHKPGNMNPPPPPPPGKKVGPLPPSPGRSHSSIGKTNKLNRSPQMNNLYRLLRVKLGEDCSAAKKSDGKKSSSSSNSSGSAQGGMAAAFADIARKSSYFKKIDEDCIKFAPAILELQSELEAFKTTSMPELLKFHQHVENLLEQLTDERKVLLRFKDFPLVKLETLQMAAGTYHTLEGIVSSLKGWRFTAPSAMMPVSVQLDKIDSYFKKIEKKVNAIEMNKDTDVSKFRSQNLTFDYSIITRIKEEMVDVSSSCIEIALKESEKAKETGTAKKFGGVYCATLWRVFQFAYRVYTFSGGQDDRANRLSDELACELQTYIQN